MLAQQPLIGVAAFVVLIGLVVWAFTSSSAVLGTSLPALALLAAIVGLGVLTVATSGFEEPRMTATSWSAGRSRSVRRSSSSWSRLATTPIPGVDLPEPHAAREQNLPRVEVAVDHCGDRRDGGGSQDLGYSPPRSSPSHCSLQAGRAPT